MKKLTYIFSALFTALVLLQPAVVSAAGKGSQAKVAQLKQEQKVNLNTAGAKELADILTGVGSKKAQAIVNYRNQNGAFESIEQLAAVKGIGVATIAKNESRIVLQ